MSLFIFKTSLLDNIINMPAWPLCFLSLLFRIVPTLFHSSVSYLCTPESAFH